MMRLASRFAGFGRAVALLCALGVSSHVLAQQPATALTTVQKTGVLRVGWAPWYPYAYKDPKTNAVSGLTVDLVNDLAKKLNVKVQWVEDGWGTMIAGLQAEKFDMLMPMAITPPRAEAATFTQPFMKTNLGVMVRKADSQKYKSWHDMDQDGIAITVAMGSNTALYAKEAFKKARIVEMKGEPEAVTSLITGKSQGWASTYSAFESSAPGRDQLAVVPGEPFAFSPVAFVVRKDDTPMRDKINEFEREEKSSGALLRAVQKQGLNKDEIAD